MKNYIPKSTKSKPIQKLINEALDIMESVGIPMNGTPRSLERMAMSFLALADVKRDWRKAKSIENHYGLSSKEIITYFNSNFEDKISLGSYDSVPKHYIKLLILADLVEKSGLNPKENYNSKNRKYAIANYVKDLIVHYGTPEWTNALYEFTKSQPNLSQILSQKRQLTKLPVKLPDGIILKLSNEPHNILQKKIVEEFLRFFGNDCEVLYIGDTSNKILHIKKTELKELNFFELSHGALPDIVAYSKNKNWLYLIEAFYSTGAMIKTRVMELERLLKDCTAELIFVTAFRTKDDFRKCITDIAWETEVWIADNPDHLIHFNGNKFLGPYKPE